MKKFLTIFSEKGKASEVVRTKSDLFDKYKEIIDYDESDFTVSDNKAKFEFLELINVELFKMLEVRVDPPKPEIQYVSIDEMYISKTVFRKKIKFLQGNEFDNKILSLLNLRAVLESSIINNKDLQGRFVNTIRECESAS